MASLPDLSGIPEELRNRMMMRRGSGMLLRAIRGEPEPQPEPAQVLQFRAPKRRQKYTPVAPPVPMPTPVKFIAMNVAEAFGLTVDDLTSHQRGQHFVRARSVFYRLVRDRTNRAGEPVYSFPRIARFVGRDHATVCHSMRMFDVYCRQDPEIAAVYERLRGEPCA